MDSTNSRCSNPLYVLYIQSIKVLKKQLIQLGYEYYLGNNKGFIGYIIIVIYYLGFYFGIQMEKTNEQDRKLFEEERKKKKKR